MISILWGIQRIFHVWNNHFTNDFFHNFIQIGQIRYRSKHFHWFRWVLFGDWRDGFFLVYFWPLANWQTCVDDVCHWNTNREGKFLDNLCWNITRRRRFVCFYFLEIFPYFVWFVLWYGWSAEQWNVNVVFSYFFVFIANSWETYSALY